MFVNKISIKDLFSTTPGNRQPDDGLGGGDAYYGGSQGNSQFPYSQVDFTQTDSGEGSQPYGQLSQSQTSGDSPGKKFYQRYMSKGPVLSRSESRLGANAGNNHGSAEGIGTPSLHQQVLNKKAVAKDRDERDILNTMLSTVQSTSTEVKDAITSLKQSVEDGFADVNDGTKTKLEEIALSLNSYNKDLITALKTRDEVKTEITTLRTQLQERTSQLEKVQENLTDLQNSREQDTLAAVSELFKEEHSSLKDSIQDMCREHKSELRTQQETHENQQQKFLEEASDLHKQLAKKLKQALDDVAKSLRSEIRSQCKDWRECQSDIGITLLKELNKMQENHLENIQDLMKSQVKGVKGIDQSKTQEALVSGFKATFDMQKQHSVELRSFIQGQLENLDSRHNSRLEQLMSICSSSNAQSQAQEELGKMKRRHQQEVEAMRRKIEEQQSAKHPQAITAGYGFNLPNNESRLSSQRRGSDSQNHAAPALFSPNLPSKPASDKTACFPNPVAWNGRKWTRSPCFNPAYDMPSSMGQMENPSFSSTDQKLNIQFSDREPNKQGHRSPLTGLMNNLNSAVLFQKQKSTPLSVHQLESSRKKKNTPLSVDQVKNPQIKSPPGPPPEQKGKKRSKSNSQPRGKKKQKASNKTSSDETDENECRNGESHSMSIVKHEIDDRSHLVENSRRSYDNLEKRLAGSDGKSSGGRALSRQRATEHSSDADVKDAFHLNSTDSTPEPSMNSLRSRYSSRADAAFDLAGSIVPSAVPSYLHKSRSNRSSRKASESDSEMSDGVFSQTSSPSMSVKEVMIRKVTKKGQNRTPVNPEGVSTETIYMQERYHSKSGYRSSASEMTIKQASPAPTTTSVGYEFSCTSPGTRPIGLTNRSEQTETVQMVRRTSSRRKNHAPTY